MGNAQHVYDVLDSLNISYKIHHHQVFFTVAEADEKGYTLSGLNLKNLFIKDKKKGKWYLVILDDHRRLDFKAFREIAGWGNKATFASDEELMEHLGLTPGSVSPFGLLNDNDRQVTVVLDQAIGEASYDTYVNFHPNVNTETISLTKNDFIRFLKHQGNLVIWEIKNANK